MKRLLPSSRDMQIAVARTTNSIPLLLAVGVAFFILSPAHADQKRVQESSGWVEDATRVLLRVGDTQARVVQYSLSGTIADQKAAEDSLARLDQAIAMAGTNEDRVAELDASTERYRASVESTFAAVKERRVSIDSMQTAGTEIRTITSAIVLTIEAETEPTLIRADMGLAETFQESDAAASRFLASRNPSDSNIATRVLTTLPIRVDELSRMTTENRRIQRFLSAIGNPLAAYTRALNDVIATDELLRRAAGEQEAASHAVLAAATAEYNRAARTQR
jgi:hypothetical protein